jgi:Protein of unknown function (DUF3105)
MASRREEKERRRQERLERERQLQAQERRRRLYAIVVGGALVVAAVAAIVLVAASGGDGGSSDSSGLPAATDPPPEQTRNLVRAAAAADCTLRNPPIEGRAHTDKPVEYKTNPPTSGNHNPQPAADGQYGKDPGTMHLVHSLEHGRVIIQWAPTVPRRRIAQLRGLFDEDPYHLILTPNGTKMPYEVAITAWGHSAGCKKFTDEAFDVFRDFKTRYVDKAPEFVP